MSRIISQAQLHILEILDRLLYLENFCCSAWQKIFDYNYS